MKPFYIAQNKFQNNEVTIAEDYDDTKIFLTFRIVLIKQV